MLSVHKPAVDTPDAPAIVLTHAGRRVVTGVLGAFAFAALTFIGANIRIPLSPVPITLQTLFVLLAGAFLGPRYGMLGQSLYVGFGALGLPLFAGTTAGLAVLLGPTGGYLLGFVAAPLFIGALIHKRDSVWWQILVFYLGSLIVLSLGVGYLTLFFSGSLTHAIQVGYLPFIPGDLLKIAAAVSIYRTWRAIGATRARNHSA